MKYRPEIDGLRAIAVTSVVLYHANFNFISGGFLGVDVFFVISGFLITSIITKQVQEGTFSLLTFYEKRARRILPALFSVILFSIPFCWFLFSPSELIDFGESIIAVCAFSSNIFFWKESGYFDAVSDFKPLLHTWSLAVEEQYYIFFPLIMIFFWRFGKRKIIISLIVVFVMSLVLAQYATKNITSSASFYLLPTRFFEILIGGLASFVSIEKVLSKERFDFQKQILSVFGFILIVSSIFVYKKTYTLPGLLTLIPITGTCLVILFAGEKTFVQKVLSNKIILLIGMISYSTYLWHQPILAFLKYVSNDEVKILHKIIVVIITHILAYLSWKYIENPFRNKNFLNRTQVLTLSIVGLLIFSSFGLYIKHNNGFENRSNVKKYNLMNYELDNTVLKDRLLTPLRNQTRNPKYNTVNSDEDKELWYNLDSPKSKILIVGNSHSNDLYNVLSNSITSINKYQIARFGIQIRNIDSSFFNSPNYKKSNILIFCSLFSKEDVIKLSQLVPQFKKDSKKIIVVKNLFLTTDYGNKTLADFIVQRSINNGIEDPFLIEDLVNNAYYEYYEQNKNKESLNEINNRYIMPLKEKFSEIIVVDRIDYMISEEEGVYYAIDGELNKFSPDSSHHTIKGAIFFGARVDKINWLKFLNE